MDRNQIWFHGTMAGIIYHLKDPFNASLQSDQSPEFKGEKKPCEDFGSWQIFPLKTDVIKWAGSSE